MCALPASQQKLIFLTCSPGGGKTTATRKVVELLRAKNVSLAGFFTGEMRDSAGYRTGFTVTSVRTGKSVVFASVDYQTSARVSKYGVKVDLFESIALPEFECAASVFICDEVGKMETFSNSFVAAVRKLVHTPSGLLDLFRF